MASGLALPAAGSPSLAPLAEQSTLRMLWLGSSSAYYHDLPLQLSEWLVSFGGKLRVEPDLAGKSGTGVQRYLEPGFRCEYGTKPGQTVLDKIRDGKFDLIVLQVPVNFLAGAEGNDSQAFVQALATYAQAARQAGARVILYEQGWGQGDWFETGDRLIREQARRLNLPIIPCRAAWKKVWAERPELELQNPPDRAHPGTLGCYLNLCCFMAALTGQPPAGLPAELRIWRPAKTDEEKAAAERQWAATPITHSYVAGLAKWMQRHSTNARLEKIDPATAAYLQQVAWDAWRTCQTQSK